MLPNRRTFWLAIIITTACALQAFAQPLSLPAVFSDHMVLQRDRKVAVWGWAAPGEAVTVEFKGQQYHAQPDSTGKWRVSLKPMPADSTPAEMTVTNGKSTLTVKDILIGEVWLCSGQSNMEWSVDRSANPEEEIANGNWPQIRHFNTPRTVSMMPKDDVDASWEVCSPDTVAKFTAVGYYFGRKLHKELDVPIGLLNCTWGGTRIEPWTPIEGFADVPELKDIYETVMTKRPGTEQYQNQAQSYLSEMRSWLQHAKDKLANDKPLTEPTPFPDNLKPYTDRQDPTTLYNGQIAPIAPYTIRGSIWYQGESNRRDGMLYFYKTQALLKGWRQIWQQDDLPYYFVQIAPYQYGNDNPDELPVFWEAQSRIETDIDHTAMVVIHDIGDLKDIHPRNKQDVGLRLANKALKRTYGYENIVDTGPRFDSIETENGRLLVRFKHIAGGLISRDDQALTSFELAGEGVPWTKAEAKIIAPDTIAVSAESIDKPVAVRFGWHKTTTPNLANSHGLPAAPFRAGDPPKLGTMLMNAPESKNYKLVYDLNLNNLGSDITYDQDHTNKVGDYDRVAYFLELGDPQDDSYQWVYVSMDAFTDNPASLGVPTFKSKARFQKALTNLYVRTNVIGVPNSENLDGWIEFWPNNYSIVNAANVPGASGKVYDTGDTPREEVPDGYGSMQIHLTDPSEVLFALNNWKRSPADLGIGNNPGEGHPDYTFTKSADNYDTKRLRVFVRPVD